MDVILHLLNTLWQFALEHSEIFVFIVGGSITGLGWLFPRMRRSLKRSEPKIFVADTFPFEVLPPQSNRVVQAVGGSSQDQADPLADFNIPYQSRLTDRNVQQELEQCLEKTGSLLILGRKGLGKTREAAELAQIYNREGWRILKLRNQECEWLAEPAHFPADKIGVVQPKLLFVLDNLNQAMFLSQRQVNRSQQAQSEDGKVQIQPLTTPIQERLLRLLQFFEESCGRERIRVIVTARNEPGEIEKLDLEQYPKLWERFEPYELPEPDYAVIETVLRDRTTHAQIAANVDEFPAIARSNDGTFRNVIENLIKVKNRNLTLTEQTFEQSLDGTWKERFDRVIDTYPRAIFVYDAIDLLRQVGIELYDFTVLSTAQMLADRTDRNRWRQFWCKRQIHKILNHLSQTERILQPRDGQIEAKGQSIAVEPYLSSLAHLLLKLSHRYPQAMVYSLFSFGVKAANRNRQPEALLSLNELLKVEPVSEGDWLQRGYILAVLQRYEEAFTSFEQATKLQPGYHEAWHYRGDALYKLGRKEEAITSYDKALEIKPDFGAWYKRGLALFDLERNEDAITSYDKALEIQSNSYKAWYMRGLALSQIKCNEDAVDSYDKALSIQPNSYKVWYIRGLALYVLGRNEEAITSYDKALEIQSNSYEAWYARGLALYVLGRNEEAITSYDKALIIQPDDYQIWFIHGLTLFMSKHNEEAITSYDKAIEIKPDDHEAWHNRGLALSTLGRKEDAIASYDKAIEFKPDYHAAWYTRGSALYDLGRHEEAIASFDKAIEFKPDRYEAWFTRGLALYALGRHDEAIASYDKAIEFKGNFDIAWFNRGISLKELGQYATAIESFNKSLEFLPNNALAFYWKACCYALLTNTEQAIENLRRAIELDPECREWAKTDTDFDAVRENDSFRELVGE